MLNWDLIKNPFNWIEVVLMIVIAMFGFHLLAQLFGGPTAPASAIPATFSDTSGT